MRLILLLVALMIVGLLVLKSMRPATPPAAIPTASTQGVPQVPTTPQGVPKFDKDINKFVNKTEQDQQKALQQATQ